MNKNSSHCAILRKYSSFVNLSIILIVSSTALSACIFTEDDAKEFIPDIPPIIEYGLLNHGQIEGIKYETDTLEGETTSIGRFRYRDGETISFKVGDIELASLPVHANFSLLDFDPGYDRTGDSYVPGDRAINILQFLHTISDASNNHDIHITPEIHMAALGQTIDFDQSNTAFSTDANVLDVVRRLTAARTGGERTLRDAVDVQVLLTENLAQRYGSPYTWRNYLDLDHGNRWTYTRTITEEGLTPQVDEVHSFLLESAWKNEKVFVQGWSDNWKLNEYVYIAQNLFDSGLHVAGFQNATGMESSFSRSNEIFHFMFDTHKWFVYRAYIAGELIPVHVKIEKRDDYDVLGTVYIDVVKQSIHVPGTDTLIERWFADDVGLIKEVTTTDTSQETVELISLSFSETFPDNNTINRFVGLHQLYDFIISGNNAVFEQMEEDAGALIIIYALSDGIGSPEHIDAFHAMYNVHLSDHALSLFNKIVELDDLYGLESETTGELINFQFNEAVLNVYLLSLVLDSDNSEFNGTVLTNISGIYQTTIDLLVDLGIMQPFELYLFDV